VNRPTGSRLDHLRDRRAASVYLIRDAMERYKNLSGTSGVAGFRIEPDAIFVEFVEGTIYGYDASRPGREIVEEMKKLALAGQGLSAFISKYVKYCYAARLK